MTVTGPPDDYTNHLKEATHEALSMTDIVERLLVPVDYLPRETRQEAADEIKRLRAVVERLLTSNAGYVSERDELRAVIARRALEQP